MKSSFLFVYKLPFYVFYMYTVLCTLYSEQQLKILTLKYFFLNKTNSSSWKWASIEYFVGKVLLGNFVKALFLIFLFKNDIFRTALFGGLRQLSVTPDTPKLLINVIKTAACQALTTVRWTTVPPVIG